MSITIWLAWHFENDQQFCDLTLEAPRVHLNLTQPFPPLTTKQFKIKCQNEVGHLQNAWLDILKLFLLKTLISISSSVS